MRETRERLVISLSLPEIVPVLTTDEEAGAFLKPDLRDLDPTRLVPFDWKRQFKRGCVKMRLPQPLLDALKAKVAGLGVPYQRLICEAIKTSL